MLNRRNFFKTTGALALGSLLLPSCGNALTQTETAAENTGDSNVSKQVLPVGLQLYTVRELMDQDVRGTLQKIAAIGYKDLESAAGKTGHYYGMKPKEFATLAESMGMKLRSSHVLPGTQLPTEAPLPPEFLTLTNGLQQLVDMAAESGQNYLTCAYMFPSEHKTLDQYRRMAELFNRAGEACKKAGLGFAYHNHDFEFETLEGQRPYDLLLAETDKGLVGMELDLYWATKSGNDPVALFEKYPGRFPMWHVKDMDNTDKKFFTEVGNGTIDFKRIFDKAELAGMKYYFVEQDQTPGDPLASITTSYNNLVKVLS
ncbi:sugar phosphate isomerase/epimerase [Pontibacter sp. 172403-2]|uniref:sugar phosphate isomerase/epimerase family protein n=1 Tax=Pontibacter rufus TaxID=2791028 RepID=UPI0018B011EA|nr:sugar phosphate isomerase/epimerase [Pontibacter sp. 172403-2]MBF9252297.1 sugar phosphate isomerase/epimerase [Pontibacter sp. 172403-2]